MPTTAFRPINLTQHAHLCVQFRRDAMACSFPNGEQIFDAENGTKAEKYLTWLAQQRQDFSQGFVHVWQVKQIVGQIEMAPRQEGRIGYVTLLYLIPEMRGIGLGQDLHQYVVKTFRSVGINRVQLSVSKSNPRALAYYHKSWSLKYNFPIGKPTAQIQQKPYEPIL
jgi:ribosomal protein S18 acetylase RimI-like enzyme